MPDDEIKSAFATSEWFQLGAAEGAMKAALRDLQSNLPDDMKIKWACGNLTSGIARLKAFYQERGMSTENM